MPEEKTSEVNAPEVIVPEMMAPEMMAPEVKAPEETAQVEKVSNKIKYHVVTVEKTAPPKGLPGDNWHRYVIGQGTSTIEGKKPGTLKAVTLHAETVTEELNSRTGRGGSTYAPRKRV